MDVHNAVLLNDINKTFYAENALSFSATRTRAWAGWERLMGHVGLPQSVLDLACGNMRFMRFLLEAMPESYPRFYCIDTCDELVDTQADAHYQSLDVVEAALGERDMTMLIDAPPCDLSVSFGFLHHVPGVEARKRIMRALVDKTLPGGIVAVSLWQFMADRKLAAKARRTTERALVNMDLVLDEGDYLLGWQNRLDAYRYCHSFTQQEADELIACVSQTCDVVDRFEADGANDTSNIYLILRKRAG